MGMLAWVIMGLALWHYTIFLPDRFWGGIVGAFLGSIAGADRGRRDHQPSVPGTRDPRAPRHRHRASSSTRSPAPCSAWPLVYLDGACAANAPAARAAPSTSPTSRGVGSRSGRWVRGSVPPRPYPRRHASCASRSRPARRRRSSGCERELGVSGVLAQVLVRRGLGEPAPARAFLEPTRSTPPGAFGASAAPVELIARAPRAGSRITVHGDYDCDGVCSTAMLVRGAARAGRPTSTGTCPTAPSDGYGLAAATVRRLAERGTRAADHASTARSPRSRRSRWRARSGSTWSSPTTIARARTACCRGAPIVHPALCGYPCPRAVRHGGRVQARAGAARGAAGATRGRARRTSSSWSRSRRSPTWCRCWARTAASCARGPARARPATRARAAGADARSRRVDAAAESTSGRSRSRWRRG